MKDETIITIDISKHNNRKDDMLADSKRYTIWRPWKSMETTAATSY